MYTGPLHHLQNCLAHLCCPFNFSSHTYTCTSVPNHLGPSHHCKITCLLIHLVVFGPSRGVFKCPNTVRRKRRRVTRSLGSFNLPWFSSGKERDPAGPWPISLPLFEGLLNPLTERQGNADVCVCVWMFSCVHIPVD